LTCQWSARLGKEQLRVHGALYLAKDKGEWKVFGYDVDEAVKL